MKRRFIAAIFVACAFAVCAMAAAPPTPESFFGHKMGEDRKLVTWSRVVGYFQSLEKTSDRIRVRELGKTTEGRPFIAAWISSASTLAQLDRYQSIQEKLADPRLTTDAEAARFIAEGKAVVMITCSIHSTEVASTMTAMEYAYRMLSTETQRNYALLDNLIVILVPSLNPDGVDIVADWYRSTLGTPYEGTNPPKLYQKYVGHDNNRDWYMFTQAETRLAVSQLHNVWHPQIVYDVHQMGSYLGRMFVPPWMDPIEPNVDPVIAQMANAFGTGIALDLTAAGKKGVTLQSTYDAWAPSRMYSAFHGGVRLLSESASVRIATPLTVKPEEIRENGLGYNPRERSWNHLEPWLGGEWRLRDIVEYQLVAFDSVLNQASARREDLLRNFYGIGKRAVSRATPAGFLIPFDQRDPAAARKLLETLAFAQVEVEQTVSGFAIPLQQPYGAWAKALLEKQDYPDIRQYPGGPPQAPYDVTAHTLPMLMGVTVRAMEPGERGRKATRFVFPQRRLASSDSDTWREVNRLWSAGSVWRDPASGDFSPSSRAGWLEKKRPRVALYQSFVPQMDEGWTRWILEQFNFRFTSVTNPVIQAGGLRSKFDVIVFPNQSSEGMQNGHRAGAMPQEFTGGLANAHQALLEFARQGGTLIFLNESSGFATEQLGIGVTNVVRQIPSRDFYSPGSLLRVTLEDRNPLTYGLPREIAIWNEHSPAWDVPVGAGKAVARYGASNLLASGWLLGEKYIAGRSALVDIPIGSGRAILFGFRPQYRGQSLQAVKLLFNALILQ
jgi:hypothetical protein